MSEAEHERNARYELLRGWVRDGLVEVRIAYEPGYRRGVDITEYRVAGTDEWIPAHCTRTLADLFPSTLLIAKLALAIAALQPSPVVVAMACFWPANLLPLRKQDQVINMETVS